MLSREVDVLRTYCSELLQTLDNVREEKANVSDNLHRATETYQKCEAEISRLRKLMDMKSTEARILTRNVENLESSFTNMKRNCKFTFLL